MITPRKGAVAAKRNSAESITPPPNKLPRWYVQFRKRFPAVAEAYENLGEASGAAGPLEGKQRALVKLGLAVGAEKEGAVHSHVRRALEAGCTPEEVRHVVLLGITTLGFPTTMKALSWVEDVLAK